MERILFIVPPNMTFEDFAHPPANVKVVSKNSRNFGVLVTDIPVGVLSLSAYLKQHADVETRIVDFNILLNRMDKFESDSFSGVFHSALSGLRSDGYTPAIIGISALFTPSYHSVLDIAQQCRELFPGALIVAGGSVATNMYQEVFRDSECLDALCYGEGELPLLRLVKAGDKNKALAEADAWITREKAAEQKRFRYEFIEDLDEIPFYDYGILERDGYALSPTISAYTSIDNIEKSMPLMTSRGCVHCCCFCASHTVHGRKMRYHSVSRVEDDLKQLVSQYGAKTIIFEDDHFMGDKQRASDIMGIMRDLRLTAFFPNSLALYALDRKTLEKFRDAGVNQLILSVESGSARVLREVMHKPLNLSIVKQVAADCRDLGIYTDANILIGLPGETKRDIEDSRAFLKTINANWFRINVATPLIGSEMFEVCRKHNYLKGDFIDCNLKKAIIETEDFTAEYIQEMAYVLNLELNFVENSDYRLGDYKTALRGFENAIRVKGDHAIAYYYAARCHEKLANAEKAGQYMEKARAFVKDPFWRKYAEMFQLPVK